MAADPESSVNPDWPETDLDEFYWAHYMYGTTVAHIVAWLWWIMREGAGLITKESPQIPPRLKRLVVLTWSRPGLCSPRWCGVRRRRSVPTTMAAMSSVATVAAAAWALGRRRCSAS